MAKDIGSQTGIGGSSMGINNQKGAGGQMPSAAGNPSPGNTKPPKEAEGNVPKAC